MWCGQKVWSRLFGSGAEPVFNERRVCLLQQISLLLNTGRGRTEEDFYKYCLNSLTGVIDTSPGIRYYLSSKWWPGFTSGLCLQRRGSQMKCGPNYILSDALQPALPSEKLISECPLLPISITFLFKRIGCLPSFLLMCDAGIKAHAAFSGLSITRQKARERERRARFKKERAATLTPLCCPLSRCCFYC